MAGRIFRKISGFSTLLGAYSNVSCSCCVVLLLFLSPKMSTACHQASLLQVLLSQAPTSCPRPPAAQTWERPNPLPDPVQTLSLAMHLLEIRLSVVSYARLLPHDSNQFKSQWRLQATTATLPDLAFSQGLEAGFTSHAAHPQALYYKQPKLLSMFLQFWPCFME